MINFIFFICSSGLAFVVVQETSFFSAEKNVYAQNILNETPKNEGGWCLENF